MSNLIELGPVGDVQEISMFGRNFNERWIDGLKRRDRAASGKLREDITSTKKAFLLSYEASDQEVKDRMDYLFELGGEFELRVTHLTETKTYTVLMSPFEAQRILSVWGGLWGGIAVEFEQV